jgi:DNA topoisomerase-3
MWDRDACESPETAGLAAAAVRKAGSLVGILCSLVCSVAAKSLARNRPPAVNTVQLLKHASAAVGLGPLDAMAVAEKLYLGGYITYPRTEATGYCEAFDVPGHLAAFAHCPNVYQELADRLLRSGYSPDNATSQAGDHPPITPTHKIPPKGCLSGQEGKIYDFICRQFFASLCRDATFIKTKVIFEAEGHFFSIVSSSIIDPGFTEVLPWNKIPVRHIPDFQKGQRYPLLSVEIQKSETLAPNLLTESELISLMEKNGIGTDASMATHIANLCERNFIEVIPRGRRLKPTDLGIALIRGYKEIDPELVSAELRSNIEKNVELISKAEKDIDSVLKLVLGIFKQKYDFFIQNIERLDDHFSQIYGTFMDSLKKGVAFSICGRCSQQMTLVEDFNKTYCKVCKVTLNLPRGATYSLEGQDRCALDGYQLVEYHLGRQR